MIHSFHQRSSKAEDDAVQYDLERLPVVDRG